MHVLIVEDDFYNRSMVAHLMRTEGHEVEEVDNPRGALEMVERRVPHLILLDVNFGAKHMNGFEFFEEIQRRQIEVPVIFMTSRDELEDKLTGFNLGADDYITKPYAPAEVAARVKSVLFRTYKRNVQTAKSQWRFDTIELDVPNLVVQVKGRSKPSPLTPIEMKLLMYLMQRVEHVVAREDLLTAVWGDGYESNIVDSYIRKLRRKIEVDAANPQFIRTVRGAGYKFTAKAQAGVA
jgi:DNA-binding response OmpR family regulator